MVCPLFCEFPVDCREFDLGVPCPVGRLFCRLIVEELNPEDDDPEVEEDRPLSSVELLPSGKAGTSPRLLATGKLCLELLFALMR